MTIPFKGVINVDIRDSTPDWAPYLAAKAPEGAPNVLIVLYDDTGLAAWSPFRAGTASTASSAARRTSTTRR